MTNRAKLTLLIAALALGVSAVFNAVQTATDGTLVVSVAASVGAAVAAHFIYRQAVLRMTNNRQVVETDHGPDGRIEAIEVFWRPG